MKLMQRELRENLNFNKNRRFDFFLIMWYTGLYKQTKGVALSNKDLENLLDWKGKSKTKSKRASAWVTCKGCGKKFNGTAAQDRHWDNNPSCY